MRGVSLGAPDHTDNWIGRLQREYAASEASAAQGWKLVDWFIKSIHLILIIRKNKTNGQATVTRWNTFEALAISMKSGRL